MDTRFRILLRGQHWSGAYRVDGGLVHVSSAYGSGSLPKGRRKAEAVAAEILHGLVEAWATHTGAPRPASRAEPPPARRV
jgi:hypothetical protein